MPPFGGGGEGCLHKWDSSDPDSTAHNHVDPLGHSTNKPKGKKLVSKSKKR